MKIKLKIIYLNFIYIVFIITIIFCISNVFVKNAKNNIFYINNSILCVKTNLLSLTDLNIPNIKIYCNNEVYNLQDFEVSKLTKKQKVDFNKDFEYKRKNMLFAYNNGFTKKESVEYAYPQVKAFLNVIKNKHCYTPENAKTKSISNTGNIKIINSKKGVYLDENVFFKDFFYIINTKSRKNNINLRFVQKDPEINDKYIENSIFLRGCHATYYQTSSVSRKNNIKQALKSLDGIVIEPNQVVSFNNITGLRNENNGYMKAKTIRNGSYYEEFGGGVCQVSSTLYNAALKADLQILEVHPHSLPVSYVQPCFDAMVNSGSSDLIIKNNLSYPVTIATSSKNDVCLVNIYGEYKDYDIICRGEKTEEINKYEKEIIYDYKEVGLDKPINKGETKIISLGNLVINLLGFQDIIKMGFCLRQKRLEKTYINQLKRLFYKGRIMI